MTDTQIIATFDWGTVRIHPNNVATVERTNGHMNKTQFVTALHEAGYRLTSAGKDMRVPYIKARKYTVAAA